MPGWFERKLAERQGIVPAPAQRPLPPPPGGHYPPQPQYGHPPAGGLPPAMQPTPGAIPMTEAGEVPAPIAIQMWRGTPDAQQEQYHCPECGSGNYFSLSNAEPKMTQNGPATPKPHCFDCGYPVVQSGSGTGVLASARSTGPVRNARQVWQPWMGFHGNDETKIIAHVR